jgi:hypothetical protein
MTYTHDKGTSFRNAIAAPDDADRAGGAAVVESGSEYPTATDAIIAIRSTHGWFAAEQATDWLHVEGARGRCRSCRSDGGIGRGAVLTLF